MSPFDKKMGYKKVCQCNHKHEQLNDSQFLFHSVLFCEFNNVPETNLQLLVLEYHSQQPDTFNDVSARTHIEKTPNYK